MNNSFGTRSSLTVDGDCYEIFNVGELPESARLPYSLKILLENLLRCEDGRTVTREDIEAILHWDPAANPENEIAFRPARVLMQDFTGVPAVVDLAAMRDAMKSLGETRKKSILYSPQNWSLTIPCRSITLALTRLSTSMQLSNSTATVNATIF